MILSEAAVDHLMRLPNLYHWAIVQTPPPYAPTSIFPSLESVWLGERETLPWLDFLASHERGTPRNGSASATPHTGTREALKYLGSANTIIDSTLISSIMRFRNLVMLDTNANCSDTEGTCAFLLTDDDMENLTAALPRLNTLRFGGPCQSDSCTTTVASLMSASIHCLDLTHLEIHFNTRTSVSDMRRLLDGGAGREKAKCKLRGLVVGDLPLGVGGEDVEIVAVGLKVIPTTGREGVLLFVRSSFG